MPILDVFTDPFDASLSLLVMPYLRPFNDPEFCTIGEVMDFIRQTLEVCPFWLYQEGPVLTEVRVLHSCITNA